jgi:hypothetical protein
MLRLIPSMQWMANIPHDFENFRRQNRPSLVDGVETVFFLKELLAVILL